MRLTQFVVGTFAALASAKTVRIMPLGDSITGTPGCWRANLYKKLQEAGITNTDFVGSLPAPECGMAYDGENEGHNGFQAVDIADKGMLPGWLDTAGGADIVMVHLGTNDLWKNPARTTEEILSAYEDLVEDMRANNPAMKIIFAQILPMDTATCPTCTERVIALNKAIPSWTPKMQTSTSQLGWVDCWTDFDTATMTLDGVHPNDAGDVKMAECWYDRVVECIKDLS